MGEKFIVRVYIRFNMMAHTVLLDKLPAKFWVKNATFFLFFIYTVVQQIPKRTFWGPVSPLSDTEWSKYSPKKVLQTNMEFRNRLKTSVLNCFLSMLNNQPSHCSRVNKSTHKWTLTFTWFHCNQVTIWQNDWKNKRQVTTIGMLIGRACKYVVCSCWSLKI